MKTKQSHILNVLISRNWFPLRYGTMLALETFVYQSGLEPSLLELVKIRASQINGCAYCLEMHSKDRACAIGA